MLIAPPFDFVEDADEFFRSDASPIEIGLNSATKGRLISGKCKLATAEKLLNPRHPMRKEQVEHLISATVCVESAVTIITHGCTRR